MKKRVLFLLLSLLLMAAIFYFSDMPAPQSSSVSKPIAESTGLSQKTVRKIAHLTCFFLLSGSLYGFFSTFRKLRRPYLFSYPTTVIYAVTDEIHQHFVEGRSCELRDVLIDAAGALLFLLLWWAVLQFLRRKKKSASE